MRNRVPDRAALIALPAALVLAADDVPVTVHRPRPRSGAAFAKGMPLIEVGDYKIHASRREGPGIAEIHTRDTDIAYVLQGSATLVTGGTAVDVKPTAPEELRGTAIQGGETRKLDARRRGRHPERRAALVQGSGGALPLLCGQGAPGRAVRRPREAM